MLNKFNKWFHSSRVKFTLARILASWFLVSMYLIWILESRLIRSNSQSWATLWVLETCLIVRLLPLMIILITTSLSSNTHTTKLLDARIGSLKEQNQCFPSHWFSCEAYDVCEHHYQIAPIHLKHEKHFQEQKQLDPIIPEQANHPISIQCPKRWFQNSVELRETDVCFLHIQLFGTKVWLPKNAQCSSRSGFRIFKISRKVIVLKTIPIYIVSQYYAHDKIVCIHTFHKFLKSIDPSVCHRLWSILRLIVQACLLTIKYQVVQFSCLPSICISEQFGSVHVTILQQISFHLLRVQPNYTWSKENVGLPKSTSWLRTFHIGSRFWLSIQFYVIHIHR